MNSLNSVTISGNLTRDCELKNNGFSIANFSVACNESKKDGYGQWNDYPNYFDCTLFGKRAEVLASRLTRGAHVVVTGRLHQDRWDAQDGNKRSRIIIYVDNLELPKAPGTTQQPAQQQQFYSEDVPF